MRWASELVWAFPYVSKMLFVRQKDDYDTVGVEVEECPGNVALGLVIKKLYANGQGFKTHIVIIAEIVVKFFIGGHFMWESEKVPNLNGVSVNCFSHESFPYSWQIDASGWCHTKNSLTWHFYLTDSSENKCHFHLTISWKIDFWHQVERILRKNVNECFGHVAVSICTSLVPNVVVMRTWSSELWAAFQVTFESRLWDCIKSRRLQFWEKMSNFQKLRDWNLQKWVPERKVLYVQET